MTTEIKKGAKRLHPASKIFRIGLNFRVPRLRIPMIPQILLTYPGDPARDIRHAPVQRILCGQRESLGGFVRRRYRGPDHFDCLVYEFDFGGEHHFSLVSHRVIFSTIGRIALKYASPAATIPAIMP